MALEDVCLFCGMGLILGLVGLEGVVNGLLRVVEILVDGILNGLQGVLGGLIPALGI